MYTQLLTLAAAVIQKSNRERPADGELRAALKSQGGLSRDDSWRVSRAVFAYYRWLGWLDRRNPLPFQIEQGLELAEAFANEPKRFSDDQLVERAAPAWVKSEMEASPAWARAIQSEPKLWLRARPGQGRALAAKLGDCISFGAGPLADALEYRGTQDLFRTPEFHAGEFELQDISSQAAGIVCAAAPGQTWWDACAGEGGKTLQLSDLMENKGMIWASDRAEWRLRKLKQRTARARVFNYRTALWNGGPKLPTRTKFDGVLVDAPCSGIGTWQRNPHARWTTTARDISELSALQTDLLLNAAASVKPGGRMIYSVCTLARSETIEVAAAFEKQSPGFERLEASHPLEAKSSKATEFCLWPQDLGGNGMFIALWKKKP
ncbi:MAG: rRNA (cytosine967-C5)-methyltransferase [Verrucomicrobiota bacterium]